VWCVVVGVVRKEAVQGLCLRFRGVMWVPCAQGGTAPSRRDTLHVLHLLLHLIAADRQNRRADTHVGDGGWAVLRENGINVGGILEEVRPRRGTGGVARRGGGRSQKAEIEGGWAAQQRPSKWQRQARTLRAALGVAGAWRGGQCSGLSPVVAFPVSA